MLLRESTCFVEREQTKVCFWSRLNIALMQTYLMCFRLNARLVLLGCLFFFEVNKIAPGGYFSASATREMINNADSKSELWYKHASKLQCSHFTDACQVRLL